MDELSQMPFTNVPLIYQMYQLLFTLVGYPVLSYLKGASVWSLCYFVGNLRGLFLLLLVLSFLLILQST